MSLIITRKVSVTGITNTTPSTGVGTGALQVAGGIYAGAASVFAGAVTVNNALANFGNGTAGTEVRASGDGTSTPYGYWWRSGSTYEASMQQVGSTGVLTLDVGRNSSWGGKFDITVDTTRSVRFAKNLTTFDQPATFAGAVTVGGVTILKNYTVATLPAAASYTYGEAYVSDATQAAGTSIGSAPTGGGSVVRGVYSNGSAWLLR